MSRETVADYGADLWPVEFHNLDVTSQVQMATQLSMQSNYLRRMPFIHTESDLHKVIDRLGQREFGWSLSFDPCFISKLAKVGFLPMAGQCFADLICLLPKLHKERCVVLNLREDIKISRRTIKRSRKYELTVDVAFDKVIEAIQDQHGDTCWFYAPLSKAYRKIHEKNNDIGCYGIRIHSVELWESEKVASDGTVESSRRLVAGEVGYSFGRIYTSLSGFRLLDASGAGTIQCCALAKLLHLCGFRIWDLGMGMQYKYELGAKDISRDEFLRRLAEMQDFEADCVLVTEGPVCVERLLKERFNEGDKQD